ncbi:diguanylate cyclase domain-containing protein [Undibacterium sp. TJN25]|uniref:diguanylate cyclase domain-containing protein n=1 Tax=Undibacterium sp. TJN25 TaxID=3413056 RepID=UPI003BF140E0
MQRLVPNLPLARKFSGYNFATILASLLATLACLLTISLFIAERHVRNEVISEAGMLAASLAPSVSIQDAAAARNQILQSSSRPGLQSVNVYDVQGRSFANWSVLSQFNGPAGADMLVMDKSVHTSWSISQLSVATPIILEDEIVGRLQLHTSIFSIYQELLVLLLSGLVLSAVAALLACYRLTRLQIQALEPVHELVTVSEQVVNLNDYSMRIWNDGEHEFAPLIQHFNQMLARIDNWESSEDIAIRQQREEEQKTDILDNHDSLTRLPNRHYFHRVLVHHVDEAAETGELAALMFIDLDNFKFINDEFGYEAGDFVLTTIAGRLATTLRGTDTLCRIGGDEFAAILPQVGSIQLAESLADRLLAGIRQPILLYGQKLAVSASIGLTCAPLHAQEQRQLLRNGDLALAAAKAAGKDIYRTHKTI